MKPGDKVILKNDLTGTRSAPNGVDEPTCIVAGSYGEIIDSDPGYCNSKGRFVFCRFPTGYEYRVVNLEDLDLITEDKQDEPANT